MKHRHQKLTALMNEKGLDSFYFTDPLSIYYLTGFRGVSDSEREATLIANSDGLHLILPTLYEVEGKELVRDNTINLETFSSKKEYEIIIKKYFANSKNIAVEDRHITLSESRSVSKILDAKLSSGQEISSKLRIIKDGDEIALCKKATSITDQVFAEILPELGVGISEREVAFMIKQSLEKLSPQSEMAFTPIVAFGKSSASPHYKPGEVELAQDSIVLIDAGGRYDGYCGDMTRTYFFGASDKLFAERYELVEKAQKRAIEMVAPGVKISTVMEEVVSIFGDESKRFIHSLGHGVGLNIHEGPSIGSTSKGVFEEGMIITIEPGLYYPGWGGIRVEDYVLVTNDGFEVLSQSSYCL